MLPAELWRAADQIEWPLTAEFSEDCRYNTLLQISIGQEVSWLQ